MVRLEVPGVRAGQVALGWWRLPLGRATAGADGGLVWRSCGQARQLWVAARQRRSRPTPTFGSRRQARYLRSGAGAPTLTSRRARLQASSEGAQIDAVLDAVQPEAEFGDGGVVPAGVGVDGVDAEAPGAAGDRLS